MAECHKPALPVSIWVQQGANPLGDRRLIVVQFTEDRGTVDLCLGRTLHTGEPRELDWEPEPAHPLSRRPTTGPLPGRVESCSLEVGDVALEDAIAVDRKGEPCDVSVL